MVTHQMSNVPGGEHGVRTLAHLLSPYNQCIACMAIHKERVYTQKHMSSSLRRGRCLRAYAKGSATQTTVIATFPFICKICGAQCDSIQATTAHLRSRLPQGFEIQA